MSSGDLEDPRPPSQTAKCSGGCNRSHPGCSGTKCVQQRYGFPWPLQCSDGFSFLWQCQESRYFRMLLAKPVPEASWQGWHCTIDWLVETCEGISRMVCGMFFFEWRPIILIVRDMSVFRKWNMVSVVPVLRSISNVLRLTKINFEYRFRNYKPLIL